MALALLAACSSKSGSDTRILVAVWSDFVIPTQMNSVRIEVNGPATTPSTTFSLAAETKFPLVFELVSPNNAGTTFTVTATGFLGATRLVSQQARVSFIPEESLVLSLFLGRTCRNIDCPTSWTCSDGQCNQSVEINPSTLPTYDPKRPFVTPDASASFGIDASADGETFTRRDGLGIDGRPLAPGDASGDTGMAVLPAGDGGRDLAAILDSGDARVDVATYPDVAQDRANDRAGAEDLVRDLVRADTAPAPDVRPPDTPGPDAPKNNVDAPPDSPATCPYACCGDSDCPGTCQTCDSSHTCVSVVSRDDPNGRCVGTCDATGACKAKRGQSCTVVPGGCIDGTTCADGICCDRACSDTCEACDVPEHLGTCTTLAAGASPRPTRTACVSSVPACAGTCDGISALCSYNSGPCGSPSCTGITYQAAGTCSNGACNYPSAEDCPNGQVCDGAACACSAPMTTCSGGLCVNLQSNSAHCGDCDRSCSSNHGSSGCVAGSCQMSCIGDYRDCSADENVALDGCETNVMADRNNCGSCGNICPNDWANATPSCANKACSHECTAPWANCDGAAGNGCETNLDTDASNCGVCTKTCTSNVCRARTCLTETRYGNTGPGLGSDIVTFTVGYLAGIQVYIATKSVITGFGVVLDSSGTVGNMYLGLYRDVLGSPSDLVATSGRFVATLGGREVPVAEQVDIEAGNYWLLGAWDEMAKFEVNSTAKVPWRYAAHSFGALPANAPVAMEPGSYYPPNIYAIVAQ